MSWGKTIAELWACERAHPDDFFSEDNLISEFLSQKKRLSISPTWHVLPSRTWYLFSVPGAVNLPNPSSHLTRGLPQTKEAFAASWSHSLLAFALQQLSEPWQCPFNDIKFSKYRCPQMTAELPTALLVTFWTSCFLFFFPIICNFHGVLPNWRPQSTLQKVSSSISFYQSKTTAQRG